MLENFAWESSSNHVALFFIFAGQGTCIFTRQSKSFHRMWVGFSSWVIIQGIRRSANSCSKSRSGVWYYWFSPMLKFWTRHSNYSKPCIWIDGATAYNKNCILNFVFSFSFFLSRATSIFVILPVLYINHHESMALLSLDVVFWVVLTDDKNNGLQYRTVPPVRVL